MSIVLDLGTMELLATLSQGTVFFCDNDGAILQKAGPVDDDADWLGKLVGQLVRTGVKKSDSVRVVANNGAVFALFYLKSGVLVLNNRRLLQDKAKFRQIIEESLPYIAQVVGGDAVLFDTGGVRVKAIHPNGTTNAEAVGRLNELCHVVMKEWRPSIGPSTLSPGSTAVRIPLAVEYGLAFNNQFVSQQRQRLLNNARQYGYARYHMEDIIGESAAICQPKKMAREAAKFSTTVLISGETGTGKELFAQTIHNLSHRASQPFIAVNCGAVPAELVESTLFGYVGGAFTGAKSSGQIGCFEQAGGGTVFLDEISEMPHIVQVKLLRVLQEREITRVGENMPRSVDVRIIASSNKSLKQLANTGKFRPDLYFRLKVFEIYIPRLRERSEDILGLIDFFIKKYSSMFGKQVYDITHEAMLALMSYSWPGNVRELQNCLEYVFNILDVNAHSITIDHLPAGIAMKNGKERTSYSLYHEHMLQTECDIVFRIMQLCNNNQSEAAKRLGLNRTTLWRILKKHNLFKEKQGNLLHE
jgi:DNA-binding NtrC family response regulator